MKKIENDLINRLKLINDVPIIDQIIMPQNRQFPGNPEESINYFIKYPVINWYSDFSRRLE
ncbi:hypothetical protein X474_02785 [Dethiosulfatarculus sandiegensis]|uniref:Uncharacterized protein n=1 Tax=Dethiosulfatarculus sandiegensis TaxID=1429043 RepID=A0A0D2JC61_9BACT|nr:hypothetical protein X474_02785 [Dethiosulfatarculus sandiegensis]